MMNTGMLMMLKSFGFDPEEITKNVKEFGAAFIEMKNQLDRIEGQLKTLNESRGNSADATKENEK